MYIRQCLTVNWSDTDNAQCCRIPNRLKANNQCYDPNCCPAPGCGGQCPNITCIHYNHLNDSCSFLSKQNEKSGKNFYQLMCAKYNYSSDDYGPRSSFYPPTDVITPITRYLVLFNEFMNFPLDTYLMYLKNCGYHLVDLNNKNSVMTSNDLFNCMVWEIYNYCNTNYTNIIIGINQFGNQPTTNPIQKSLVPTKEGPYQVNLTFF
jgi:hypothetical protein